MLRSRAHTRGFARSAHAGRRPITGMESRIWRALTGRCVALSNSTVNRRKRGCAGLGWVRGRGEASDEVTVNRGIARGIGSMASQAFSTRSACAAALTDIGRSPFVPWRAVIGGQGSSIPLRPGPRGVAAIPLGRGARPSFAGLAIVAPRGAAAEPNHAPRRLPAPTPRRGAILVADRTIPMDQTALTKGTAPARRPRRPAADRCGSITFMPGTLRRAWDVSTDRAAPRPLSDVFARAGTRSRAKTSDKPRCAALARRQTPPSAAPIRLLGHRQRPTIAPDRNLNNANSSAGKQRAQGKTGWAGTSSNCVAVSKQTSSSPSTPSHA
jgi:hypothetical protein